MPAIVPTSRRPAAPILALATIASVLLALAASCASPPDQGDDDEPPRGTPTTGCMGGGHVAQPFGNHGHAYTKGSILPGNHAQRELDDSVAAIYDAWKARYLKSGCGAGRYYVATGMDDAQTVSEAHGYGMLIAAFLAGHDPQARSVFDGLFHYFRDHPTDASKDLMAWSQDGKCSNNQGADSATDGDLDIAYALLLADKQWGSDGDIDYHGEALKVIAAIGRQEVDVKNGYLLLGNWASPGTHEYNATRTSDMMPGHLRSFAVAAGDRAWTQLATATYDLIAKLQADHPETGLLPDFVVDPSGAPRPAEPKFLENPTDGDYSYNACRDPWRLAVDFLVGGDTRARDAVQSINVWIRGATGGDPQQIQAGYHLDGSAYAKYADAAFTAPLGAGAMVDAANQAWLDDLWDALDGSGDDSGYYGDTLRLLSMITMSGNWWAPEAAPCGGS